MQRAPQPDSPHADIHWTQGWGGTWRAALVPLSTVTTLAKRTGNPSVLTPGQN